MDEDIALRLSGQRALLQAIHRDVRLVKAKRVKDTITFTAICDLPFSDDALDLLLDAAGEMAADFPNCIMDEHITGSSDPLPKDDLWTEGWLFARAEP